MRSRSIDEVAGLKSKIERLKSLDLDRLRVQWRNALGKKAPAGLPRTLVIKVLAFRIQADALGDLDDRVIQILDGFASRNERAAVSRKGGGSGIAASAALNIKPGSLLVREWNGRLCRVMALDVGFAWEGRIYRSLSEVARAITGARWNGRRFFGVDKPRGGTREPEAILRPVGEASPAIIASGAPVGVTVRITACGAAGADEVAAEATAIPLGVERFDATGPIAP